MQQLIFIFMFLFVSSFAYAQVSSEILRSDVINGNLESVQTALNEGAVINSTTTQRLWEAIMSFNYGIAHVLLDALFEHGIDVANCKASSPLWDNRYLHVTDMIDSILRTVNLTNSDIVHLRSIKRRILNQSYVDLSTCY